ncbi:MAG TPA: hypothetical protein VE732_09550, partial [Nitrososphaera sp.]|nr:hypothetical protein [Nitrososphaera sp.]
QVINSLERPPPPRSRMKCTHTHTHMIRDREGNNCIKWQEDLFSPLRRSIFDTDANTADRLWTLRKQRDTQDL